VLSNDVQMKLTAQIDVHLLRHELQQSGMPGSLHDDMVNDLIKEIADHGVFGAAFKTVRGKLSDDGPSPIDGVAENLPKASANLLSFFHDRLKVFLRDQGIRHDVIDACIAMDGNDDLTLLVKRARALEDFMKSDDGENLLQGYKRANNILIQAETKDGVEYSYGGDVKFAKDASEIALFEALALNEGAISSAIEAEDFAAAMGSMAALRAPIDAFFEAVQVNDDNDVVRRNRLNLLHQIRQVCGQVADLTVIEG
jgi:glycyl-tRNA synthetase beta chain